VKWVSAFNIDPHLRSPGRFAQKWLEASCAVSD